MRPALLPACSQTRCLGPERRVSTAQIAAGDSAPEALQLAAGLRHRCPLRQGHVVHSRILTYTCERLSVVRAPFGTGQEEHEQVCQGDAALSWSAAHLRAAVCILHWPQLFGGGRCCHLTMPVLEALCTVRASQHSLHVFVSMLLYGMTC